MSTTHNVGLVGCASAKLRLPAPARELYVSQLFKKVSAYAGQTCDRWYVVWGSPWPYEVPMKGLGIGQQLGWSTDKLSAARQARRPSLA